MTATASVRRRTSAWAVHAFTASGVAFGLMALIRVIEGNAEATLLWLGAALVVDGLDGFFARKVGVKEVLPHFDGAILDLVIDYLNYVVVPAIFLYRFGLLPDRLGIAGAAFILLTSLYCFSNVNMKSGDNYFVGFPAIWNVIALYLFVAGFSTTINAMIVAVIGVLTFTSVKFLHPFRVRRFMAVNIGVTVAWLLSSLFLVLHHPNKPAPVLAVWLASTVYYVGICAWRTVRGPAAR